MYIYIYAITYLLTCLFHGVLLEQLVKKFPLFYVARRFITAFRSARPLPPFWAKSIQSMSPHLIYGGSILILSSHLRLGLPSGLFYFQASSPKPVCNAALPHNAACPTHLILLVLMNWIIFGEEYRSLSSSLCSLLHSPVTLSLLGPNTLLNTLFFNTISLRSSLKARDQVSEPYKTTGKNYSFIYFNLYIFV